MGTATSYTAEAIDSKLATKVNKDGAETITGVKTFGSFPLLPNSLPTTALQAASKGYVDAAINSSQGYTVVNEVEEIPEGSTPGHLFLVINAPNLATLPEIINVEKASTSASGENLTIPIPADVEDGDLLLALLTAQTSTDGPWSTPSGWSTDFSTTVNNDFRITAVRSLEVADASSLPSDVTFSVTGTTGQRRAGMIIAIRGAAESGAVIVGTPSGFNGVGLDDTTVASVVNPAPKGLHFVLGWSNGNTTSSNSPASPSSTGGMTLLDSIVEPPTPSGGFTTAQCFVRDLETSGASGSIVLDWPHLSQRGGVAVVVACKEE